MVAAVVAVATLGTATLAALPAIVAMMSSGFGYAVVDLSRAAPLEWSWSQSVDMRMEFPARRPEDGPVPVSFSTSYTGEVRRD